MDLRLSNDDRVGGNDERKRGAKPAARGKAERIEPKLEGGSAKPTGKAKPVRGKAKVAPARKKKRKRGGIGGFIVGLFYWGFVFAIWGGIALAGVVAYYAAQMPSADTWAIPQRPPNIRILAADGQLMSNRGKTGGEAVSLRDLPAYVPAAVISIEDRRFMTHFGVDPIGIVSVMLESLRAGHVTRGGSTLTQQLAKNLFLTPDQTLGRKVQEALLALWLERNYSKQEILELYLNRVYFGSGATGIQAAAQIYYGKSAANLSLGEAATLAGLLQAPSRNPKLDPEGAAARANVVLQSMAEEGYITPAEAKAAKIDPNQTVRTKIAGSESYVADWVESLMTAYIGDIKEDVIVSTTINWDLQKQAEFIVKEAVANEGQKRGFTQGALVAMDTDGTVRAMVGGVDYQASQYNRAVTSRRQPGSTFKPFVYLAAMEKGYTPDTVADDAPFTYNGWSPNNASHKYAGPVTLRNGLAYSLNTISARLCIDVGPQTVVDTAMRLGISSPLDAVPSIALGTSEVSLLELTAAYAPFANGGNGVIANVITKIETASGKVLYEAIPGGPGRVIQPNIVAEMNDMLTTAVQVGTGKAAHVGGGWQIGGKTGTSQHARDALFVGFTAHMVTGVWLGNDDNVGTTLSGGNVPVQIWSDFMTKAHEGVQMANLPNYENMQVQEGMIDANTPMQPKLDANGQPVLTPDGQQVYEPVPQAFLQPAAQAPVPGVAADGTTQITPDEPDGQSVTDLINGAAVTDPNAIINPAPITDPNAVVTDPNAALTTAPLPDAQQQVFVDANGNPVTIDANGQIVPPSDVGTTQQPQPVQPKEKPKTLMDLFFGNNG